MNKTVQAGPTADIRQFVPDFPDIRPESLARMTPEIGAAYLQKIDAAWKIIQSELAKNEAQKAAREEEIARTKAEVKAEFGVDSLEALEALQVEQQRRIIEAFGRLTAQVPMSQDA